MLKLYDYPDCPFCQKVRVVLAEKDLEYEKIFVDLRRQEQKMPEFLRLNPYGKVPVLVDEDEVGPQPCSVFFTRGQSRRIHCSIRASSRSKARDSGF